MFVARCSISAVNGQRSTVDGLREKISGRRHQKGLPSAVVGCYAYEMGDYRDLRVWEAAVELAVQCYSHTERFPKSERFGLTSQLRRAAVSIPANIAEGAGRKTDRDFVRFLRIAGGSANEVETLLRIALRLGYLEKPQHDSVVKRVLLIRRQLAALERRLRSSGR